MLRISALGEFEVSRNGIVVPLRTRREAALLAFLLCGETPPFYRAALAGMLWPSATSRSARHSLSQHIYDVRRRLPELQWANTNATVNCLRSGVWTDVGALRAAFASKQYREVLNLYRGHFLETVTLPDSECFEEWRYRTASEISALVDQATYCIVDDAEVAGRWHEVIGIASLGLKRNPKDRVLREARIQALAATGRTRDAVIELDALVTELQKHRSSEPSDNLAELLLLAEQWRIGGVAETPEAPTESALFVGRTVELRQFRSEWNKVRQGQGRIVVVHGAAGIGKTMLCERFLRIAAIQGARIFDAACFESEQVLSYGVIADALKDSLNIEDLQSLDPIWSECVLEIIPEAVQDYPKRGLPPLGREGSQRRMFEGVTQLFISLARRRPTVLFIDDVQWIDSATAALLSYIARQIQDHRILVICSLRTEANPRRFVSALVTGLEEQRASTLVLGELSEQECLEYVNEWRRCTGRNVDSQLADVISYAGGHPLFLTALLEAVRSIQPHQGSIERKAWSNSIDLPHRVEAYYQDLVQPSSDSENAVMSALAVIGTPVSLTLLSEVTATRLMEVAKAADSLIQKAILREYSDHRIGFVHALVRDVVVRGIGPTTSRQIHRRTADVLISTGGAPQKIVTHLIAAGEPDRAIKHALAAADASERVCAYNDAAYYLRLAYELAPTEMDKERVGRRWAAILIHMRQMAEATAVLKQLNSGHKNEQGDVELEILRLRLACYARADESSRLLNHARRLILRIDLDVSQGLAKDCIEIIGVLAYECGNMTDASEVMRHLDSIRKLSKSAEVGERAAIVRSLLCGLYVDADEGVGYALGAVRRSWKSGQSELEVAALMALGDAYVYAGCLASAEYCYYKAESHVRSIGSIAFLPRLHHNQSIVALEKGESERALALLARADEASGDAALAEGFSALSYANLYWERGQWNEARASAMKILDARAEIPWWSRAVAHGFAGLSELECGRLAKASRHRDAVLEELSRTGQVFGDLSYPEMLIARLASLEGRRSEAVARLSNVIDAYGNREACCRIRLLVERARLLAKTDPNAAYDAAVDARNRAAVAGAVPLRERAEAIIGRMGSPAG